MREEVRRWVEQADADYKTASDTFVSRNYSATAFFCQQAVERALKALYIHRHASSPPRSHALHVLADAVKLPPRFTPTLNLLTPAYTMSRYPDPAGGSPVQLYDRDTATFMLHATQEVLLWIHRTLGA